MASFHAPATTNTSSQVFLIWTADKDFFPKNRIIFTTIPINKVVFNKLCESLRNLTTLYEQSILVAGDQNS